MASYALTDPIVIDALNAAERRGVAIRIVLDPRERHDFVKLGDLSDNVRIKRGGPFMHLKAYAIDGELLRTGSANFSTSGENAQDNDLIVIRDAGAAAKFDAHFERMWDAAQPMIEFGPAIQGAGAKGSGIQIQDRRRVAPAAVSGNWCLTGRPTRRPRVARLLPRRAVAPPQCANREQYDPTRPLSAPQ